jgi:hypothetical protein
VQGAIGNRIEAENHMAIRFSLKVVLTVFVAGLAAFSYAEDEKTSQHHNLNHSADDKRISLGLSPEMQRHQLSNMRSHLEAVQTITGLIAEEEFERASEIAYSKLGLTEEMRMMCMMFNNEEFTALGLAFHKSGDSLGDALKTKNTAKSLRALQATLGYCVQCHARFRQ